MRTARDLKPEELAAFRAAARERERREQDDLRRRRERAWELAREAAELLKRDFGATRVVAYGSLLDEELFTPWSDVDLAAYGLDPKDTWRALGAVMDLSSDIELNLVDVGACRPEILEVIERTGVSL